MCGRWAVPYSAEYIEKRYKISSGLAGFKPSYNIAPTTDNLTVVNREQLEGRLMRWGLIPFWAKDPSIGNRLINARAETVANKPLFKRAFLSQRCLIPAGGFFEWQKVDTKTKIPYYIRLKNENIFSFAGIYDRWKNPDGRETESFTIITTDANGVVKPIHNRMPVIVSRADEDKWLDPEANPEFLLKLLRPYPDETHMEAFPVSSMVNSPANNTPKVIEPLK